MGGQLSSFDPNNLNFFELQSFYLKDYLVLYFDLLSKDYHSRVDGNLSQYLAFVNILMHRFDIIENLKFIKTY